VKTLSSIWTTIDNLAIDEHHQEIQCQLRDGWPIQSRIQYVPRFALGYDKLSIVKKKVEATHLSQFNSRVTKIACKD
jgi:hypothetical protein